MDAKPLKYDVFVIGTGTAGQQVAEQCAKAGLTVGIADNHVYGGTCANRGCDPKKVLITIAEIAESVERLKGRGIDGNVTLNWKDLMSFKNSFTNDIPENTEKKLVNVGIDLYHQAPTFVDANTLQVESKTIQAKKIVIATGLVPTELSIEGAKFLYTSEDFFNMAEVPPSAIFIGAGYVGLELAHILAVFGCKVTIVEKGERILQKFDPYLSDVLMQKSKALGIKFLLNTETKKIEKLTKNFRLEVENEHETITLESNIVFNTAGRVPALQGLGLDAAEVTFSNGGIKVNEYLQSVSNNCVYACGDVADHSLPLTPLSGIEGNLVAENIIETNKKRIETKVVPSTVFTFPNLASVGLSEDEAVKRYKDVIVSKDSVSHWFNAERQNETAYAYKILINQRTDKIIGAHILGPHAAETINFFALAINQNMTTSELKSTILTYPTMSSDIKSMI